MALMPSAKLVQHSYKGISCNISLMKTKLLQTHMNLSENYEKISIQTRINHIVVWLNHLVLKELIVTHFSTAVRYYDDKSYLD